MFDIRDCLNQIVDIMMDKANMKKIKIEQFFEGFNPNEAI